MSILLFFQEKIYDHILYPAYCLSDDDIEQCLELLSNQWPEVKTQPPCYIQRPEMFDCAVRYNVGKYAQVLHMADAKHWVAVTNVGANWGEVRYFDSLTLDVTHSTKCAIASK